MGGSRFNSQSRTKEKITYQKKIIVKRKSEVYKAQVLASEAI